GTKFTHALRFQFTTSNNEAEYEALIAGLRIASQIGVHNVHVSVDSKLVANQVLGTYVSGNGYHTKDKKKAKNKQNQARNGKGKVKSKPKSVKVRKSTPTKSKVNQMKKIQLEGLKLPNLKLYYKNNKDKG
ncbi:reverse transcriptase domain-containing protein, partial [Tanacetum coccineum]